MALGVLRMRRRCDISTVRERRDGALLALSDLRPLLDQPPRKLGGSYFSIFRISMHQQPMGRLPPESPIGQIIGHTQTEETKAQCGREKLMGQVQTRYTHDDSWEYGKRSIKRREALLASDVVEVMYSYNTEPTIQLSRAENQHDAAATTE
jgi:hypothetical protein